MSKRTEVEQMIDKAAKADKPDDAMKFAQAALNAANALCALKVAEEK
jgi:hypothetical protein